MGAGFGAGMVMAQQMGQAMNPGGASAAAPGGPPPIPQPVQYYVAINGQQAGPFDAAALRQKIAEGAVTRETLVWKQGMANWTAAGQVADVAMMFGSVPPPIPGG